MADEAKAQRGVSTIQFPYRDLESSIALAHAIQASGALDGLTADQLAGELGINGGTGNFLGRVGAARLFGLVTTSAGKYRLTELGYEILDKDEQRQRAARVRAFLSVPLYKKTYDGYRGRALPSRPHGLERAFIDFGVAPKQKDNARRAFEQSARFAGFFGAGEDRLVEPVIGLATQPEAKPPIPEEWQPAERTGTMVWPTTPPAPPAPSLHPFVQGLLQSLPAANSPSWPLEERIEWLKLAVHSFNVMFKSEGEITIAGVPKAKPAAAPPPDVPRGGHGQPHRKPEVDDDLPPAGHGGRPAARGGKAELDEDIPF